MTEGVQLDDGEKSYFEKFETVFNSEAWAELVKEWRDDLATIPVRAFYEAKSWDEILAARALVEKLREYIAYPRQIDFRKQNILAERAQLEADNRESLRPDV